MWLLNGGDIFSTHGILLANIWGFKFYPITLWKDVKESIAWVTAMWVFQDFTLDMYFRQFWQDPRLSFSEPGLEKLVVGAEYIKLIWVPDTFFVNEKTAYFHDATTENQFLRILHTGEILRSIRWVVPKYHESTWYRTKCLILLCRSGYNSFISTIRV